MPARFPRANPSTAGVLKTLTVTADGDAEGVACNRAVRRRANDLPHHTGQTMGLRQALVGGNEAIAYKPSDAAERCDPENSVHCGPSRQNYLLVYVEWNQHTVIPLTQDLHVTDRV
jgi:hypothetical protein